MRGERQERGVRNDEADNGQEQSLAVHSIPLAEGVGFEPTFACAKTVFKTVTIGLSVTPPGRRKYSISRGANRVLRLPEAERHLGDKRRAFPKPKVLTIRSTARNNSHLAHVLNGASCPEGRKGVLCTGVVVWICRARPPDGDTPLLCIAMRLLNGQPFFVGRRAKVPGSCPPSWG